MARSGAKRDAPRAGDETRAKIIDAALASLHEEGILGASARAIARRGSFNQALIFYHFGSVDELLLAAVDELSARRAARYESRLEEVSTLPDLVEVAGELHAEDLREGHITVLSQMLAAAATNEALRAPLKERFDPWVAIVERTLARAIETTPYAQLVPTHDLALAITALFVGLELMLNLEEDDTSEHQIFQTITALARLLDMMLAALPPLDVAAPDGGP